MVCFFESIFLRWGGVWFFETVCLNLALCCRNSIVYCVLRYLVLMVCCCCLYCIDCIQTLCCVLLFKRLCCIVSTELYSVLLSIGLANHGGYTNVLYSISCICRTLFCDYQDLQNNVCFSVMSF